MQIQIQTIPHNQQAYPTVGNYELDGDTLKIYVSELGNPRYEMLVAIHEFCEAVLCGDRGISFNEITKFDKEFEAHRTNDSEPGDDPKAPYRQEHLFASGIEKLMAAELGIEWQAYEQTIHKL
jgi:hypothetical protein